MTEKLLLLMVLVVSLAATGCTNEDAASRALGGAGYTAVQFTGWRAFGCSDSDDFAVGFTATRPTGQHVRGVVCSGILKGATIRTD